jgi:hypothetical protein
MSSIKVLIIGTNGRLEEAIIDVASLNYTRALSADQTTSSVTLSKVTNLDVVSVPVGVYRFKYMVRYQSALTTTGIRFSVNFTGTTPFFNALVRWSDVSAAASTGAPDQDQVLATGAVIGAFAARTKSVSGWGTTISVDTANADMLTIIEGHFEATVAGDLQLFHGSEVAGGVSVVKAGTNLILTRIN